MHARICVCLCVSGFVCVYLYIIHAHVYMYMCVCGCGCPETLIFNTEEVSCSAKQAYVTLIFWV